MSVGWCGLQVVAWCAPWVNERIQAAIRLLRLIFEQRGDELSTQLARLGPLLHSETLQGLHTFRKPALAESLVRAAEAVLRPLPPQALQHTLASLFTQLRATEPTQLASACGFETASGHRAGVVLSRALVASCAAIAAGTPEAVAGVRIWAGKCMGLLAGYVDPADVTPAFVDPLSGAATPAGSLVCVFVSL